jgi:DNA topoisomerase II
MRHATRLPLGAPGRGALAAVARRRLAGVLVDSAAARGLAAAAATAASTPPPPPAATAAGGRRVEDVYQKKDPVSHVLLRPGMYIGSTAPHTGEAWVFDPPAGRMVRRPLTHSPGLLKIFDEILVNACDNRARDPAGMTRLEVAIYAGGGQTTTTAAAKRSGGGGKGAAPVAAAAPPHLQPADPALAGHPVISVLNDGRGIPVAWHSGEGVYVPELVLGQLLTGSNFDDGDDGGGSGSGGGGGSKKAPKPAADAGAATPASSADDGAVTGGRHGYGAKLTNIFSLEFTVETADSRAGKLYRQTWRGNMRHRGEPVITDLPPGSADYTRVTFVPDLARFTAGGGSGAAAPRHHGHHPPHIDEGTLALMHRRVIDAAGTLSISAADGGGAGAGATAAGATAASSGGGSAGKRAKGSATAGKATASAVPPVAVTLNGAPVPVHSWEDYARLYCPPQPPPPQPSRPAAAAGAADDGSSGSGDGDTLEDAVRRLSALAVTRLDRRWEVAVGVAGVRLPPPTSATTSSSALTADGLAPYNAPVSVSFVNGMHTARGGSHVSYLTDQLARRLAEAIAKRPGAGPLGITPAHVKPHLRLFINARVPSPSFDSQAKEQLVTPLSAFVVTADGGAGAAGATPIAFTDKFVRAVCDELGVGDAVLEAARARAAADAARSVKRTSRTSEAKVRAIPKLEDANWAGGRRAAECTLILTEGDSAKALAVAGLAVVGRDAFGVFPLKGKLLNVRDLTPAAALENTEVAALVQILGLDFGRSYGGEDAGARGLRYGRVLVMADQDVDGSHIKGEQWQARRTRAGVRGRPGGAAAVRGRTGTVLSGSPAAPSQTR